uniref:S100P-binding protein n=1 Tax=Latimeria chalumnae TaxID=7897 RepID=H3B6V7_LATCH
EEELLDDSLLMCSDSEKGDSPFDYTEEEIQDILGFDEPSSKDLQDRKEEVMAGASQYEASSSLVVEGQESAIAQKLESTQDENMQDGDLNSKGHLDKTETLLQSTVPNNLSNNNQETKERLGIDNAEPANSSNSTNLKMGTEASESVFVKREILGEKHPPCDNSQVSLEKKMGKVIPILKPKPRKKANKKGEMESRKETYLQCVLSHVTDPTGGSQGTMSELLTLMDQVASVEYKNQNRLWQHPSDLTARNYPRFSEKPVVKCSLHQWAAENRYHQRFQYLRDQFQRSPVPARTPI